MRFHVGFSFRLKTLKKFLIPFLIGLLAYFGFGGFTGFTPVNAYTNDNTYYNLDYSVFDNIDYSVPFNSNTSLTLQDILDYGSTESSYYNIITLLGVDFNGNYSVYFYLVPKEYDTWSININGTNSSSVEQRFQINTKYNLDTNVNFYSKSLSASSSSSTITDTISALNSCLSSNSSCGSSMTTSYIGWQKLPISTPFQDNQSYNIYDSNYISNANYMYVPYMSQVTLINSSRLRTDNNNYFFKSIKIDDNLLEFGDEFPTLYEYQREPVQQGFVLLNYGFNQLYSNFGVNDLSTYKLEYQYNVDDLTGYVNNIEKNIFSYYGRIDHGTYYSYENISCSNTMNNLSVDTTYHVSFDNFTCTSDLSSYDKLFIYHSVSYIDKSFNTFNTGLTYSSNKGNLYYSNEYLGSIYDNFDSMPYAFSLLLSSNKMGQDTFFNYYSTNDYVYTQQFNNFVEEAPTSKTNGNWFSKCQLNGICHVDFGNHVYSTTVLLAQDIGYSGTNALNNLKLFFDKDIIISKQNYSGEFTYYDTSGNIQTSVVYASDDTINPNDNYNLDGIFKVVDDYLTDLEDNMLELHDLLQSCYDVLPSAIQTFVVILYILSLSFILFRIVRK